MFTSLVVGNAMYHTGLTVEGCVQLSVACNLVEIPSSVEKGLCPGFRWVVPKPALVGFKDLKKVGFIVSVIAL